MSASTPIRADDIAPGQKNFDSSQNCCPVVEIFHSNYSKPVQKPAHTVCTQKSQNPNTKPKNGLEQHASFLN
jgi:hypothetical protein